MASRRPRYTTPTHRIWLLAALLVAATGCNESNFRVVLVYPDQQAFQRAAIAHLLVGENLSCQELERDSSRERLSFAAQSDAPELGAVAVGPAAFLARVTQADCQIFLAGCVEREITPADETAIRIDLKTIDGAGCAAQEICIAGRCQRTDAAVADGAMGDGPPADAATSDGGDRDAVRTDTSLPPVTVLVEPVYPLHADWNSYVKNDDPAADSLHQDDVGCEPGVDNGGYRSCVHGGELRRVVLAGHRDCMALEIRDDRGLFSWTCQDHGGGGPVEFYSTGLATGRGLADLITDTNGGSFRINAVTITRRADNATVASSTPAPWGWNNQVLPLPDNHLATSGKVNLDQPGAIYFLAGARASSGYGITAPRVGLVTLPGATLSYSGRSEFNCHEWLGPTGEAHHRCLLAAANHMDFLWIEGSFNGEGGATDARYGIMLPDIEYARLHQVELTGVSEPTVQAYETYALELRGYSRNNLFTDLYIHHARAIGLYMDCCGVDHNEVRRYTATNLAAEPFAYSSGEHNTLAEVLGADNGRDALVFGDSNRLLRAHLHHGSGNGLTIRGAYHVVVDVVVSNSTSAGLRISDTSGSNDHTLVHALTASNDGHGLYTQWGHRNTWSHITAVDNLQYGFHLGNNSSSNEATGHTTNQLLAVNNLVGINIDSTGASGGHRLHDSALLHSHGSSGEIVARDPDNRFTGALLMSTAACTAAAGSGLVDGTCTSSGLDGSSDYGSEGSSAVLSVPLDATASFVGPVAADSVNGTGQDGTAVAAGILGEDWWSFENSHRAWGREPTSPLFAADQAGRCSGSATCRLNDWRLRADDSALRGHHGDFVPGQPCPAAAHGDQVLQDLMQKPHYNGINAVELTDDAIGDNDGACESGERCANRFLIHAYEIVLDGRGDDDGLCESGEACVFAPNIGYYQGEGELSSAPCLFADGAVIDVDLFGHLANGAP